jgi:5'(3')-deoxyribonucleotidase
MQQFNEKFTVFIDADGVLAGFEEKVSQINGLPFNKIDKRKVWTSISNYDRDVEPFYESLPVLPDAHELINFIKSNFINYYVLTACGRTPKNASEQKRNWFKKHFPSLHVKTVISSEQKAQYACETCILIDDRNKSIDPWVQAGGIGILHTSARNSILQLKNIIVN